MKVLRRITSGAIRLGLPHLNDAPPEAIRTAYRVVRWIAARFGATVPGKVDDRFLRTAVGIVARAVAETPYGRPLRFESPLLVTLAVSGYCPFSCANCYSSSGKSVGNPASEQAMASFEHVAVSKTPVVLITGGEPMVSGSTRPGVSRLLDAGKAVYISTNASIADYVDMAERWSTLVFIFPVWGNRARHDELRGPRSFERVEQNLRLLNSRGRDGWVLVVLTGTDLSEFDDLMTLAQSHSISLVRITRKVRVGRNDGPGPEVTPEFARAVRERARQLRRHVPNVVVDIPELRGESGSHILQALLGIPRYTSCAAGNWMMHIDAGGRAYPCYTFEGTTRAVVASTLSVADQWRLVQRGRAELGDGDICVGEAVNTTTDTIRHPPHQAVPIQL